MVGIVLLAAIRPGVAGVGASYQVSGRRIFVIKPAMVKGGDAFFCPIDAHVGKVHHAEGVYAVQVVQVVFGGIVVLHFFVEKSARCLGRVGTPVVVPNVGPVTVLA